MMKRISAVVLVLGLAALLAGCGGERGGAKAGEKGAKNTAEAAALLAASDVGRVVRTDLAAGVPVTGTLTPAVDVKITAPTADVIDAVLVEEGQPVEKGQVLARFRTNSTEPAARSARAQLQVAKADYERQKNLFAEGAVSKRDVEAAEASYHVAQANAAQAGKRLSESVVRAPRAGVIATKSVAAGDRPGEGDPMFQLVDTRELRFEATIPSEFVPQIHVGSEVSLDVTGLAAGSVRGRVSRINAAVDEATRQVKVYVNVPNPGGRLVGGLFASGTVITKESREVLAAPAAGVRTEGGLAYAMVIERGKIAKRAVKSGLRDESRDLVEILSGLAVGDVVVTGPIEGLEPGRAVQVGGKES